RRERTETSMASSRESKKRLPKVSVIGLGKLGLPFAVSLASRGFLVKAFDVSKEVVQQLAEGDAPSAEAPTGSLLVTSKSRISIADSGEDAVLDSDVTFVIVATPSQEDGGFSTSHVENVMERIGKALRKKREFHLIVLMSTVEPGTCEAIVK